MPRPTSFLAALFALAAVIGITKSDAQDRSPPQAGRAIIVLDGSGSMWGRIDGEPKISVARAAVRDLLSAWEPSVEVGLMTYGHRRRGDCTDIEMIVPVGAADRPDFERALEGLNPQGKTPLTAAVRQAAEGLSYEDTPATVILVSDGRETCNADPCAVARELEQRGVAFTAHVIGFDVQEEEAIRQLRCLAEETGGRFVSATSPQELNDALRQTGRTATETSLRLIAHDGEGGPAIGSRVIWTVTPVGATEGKSLTLEEAQPTLGLAPGRYRAEAQFAGRSGQGEIELARGASETLHVTVPLPAAAISAPEQVGAGAAFTVEWDGPAVDTDYVTIVRVGADEGTYNDWEYVETPRGSAELRAPDEPGEYEVRYVSGPSGRTLASQSITVGEGRAVLEAPAEAQGGATISIKWRGPANEGDYITIVPADADEGSYERWEYVRQPEGSMEMRVPDEPGKYEIRYVSGSDSATFGRVSLTVTETQAGVTAPESVGAGAHFEVRWRGPASEGDYITIVPEGAREGSYTNYVYTREPEGTGRLRAPDEPGTYEVRYVSGGGSATFASTTIEVTPASATVTVPESVIAEQDFEVRWSGPANEGDYVTIVEAGAREGSYAAYEYVRQPDGSVTMTAPDEPGEYEVRYVSGGGSATFGRASLRVVAGK